jgi:two-component system, cell cycle sensor histidine kinase and response regulator CckA
VHQLMIYSGEGSQSFESVDVSLLISEMLPLLKVSIAERAILKVSLPEKLPAVRANAAQIRQVLVNLITNASESLGGKGGVISVTVAQALSGPDSRAPHLHQGHYVRLEVTDNGCGIAGDIRAKIFDPFFTTKFTGRGLGLAIVERIIRNHGGTINVVSAPGQGSRFEVLLPLLQQTEGGTGGPG